MSRVRRVAVAPPPAACQPARMGEDPAAVSAQIVAAASRLFLSAGYEGVSTEEIARSIGRSKKTLYKHFPTKQALLDAVLVGADAELTADIAALMAQAGADPLGGLRAALLAIAGRLAGLKRSLLRGLAAAEPALGHRCWVERRRAVGRMLGPILVQASADGLLRGDLDAERFAAVYVAAIEGLAAADDADAGFPVLVTLLVDGLRRR